MFGHNNSNAQGGTKRVCNTEIRYNEESRTVYSHSTIKFVSQGKWYTLNLNDKEIIMWGRIHGAYGRYATEIW